jgi:chromate transporter
MNAFVLYLVLLKATITTFSGLASLPQVRDELVLHRHVLTDEQLNTAIVVARTTPGPVGLYLVSVGYMVAGVPGATAGWLAMATPALTMILLLRFIGPRRERPRVKQILESVVAASAALLFASAIPMARESLTDPITIFLCAATTVLMIVRKMDPLILIGASAVITLAAATVSAA